MGVETAQSGRKGEAQIERAAWREIVPTAGLRVDGDLDRAQQRSQRRGARARHPGNRLDLDGNRLLHEGARGNEEGHTFPHLRSVRVIVSDRNPVETTQLPQLGEGIRAPWYQDFVTCFSVLPLHSLILASLLAPSLPSAGLGGHPHLCIAPGLSHPSAEGVHAFDLKKAPDLLGPYLSLDPSLWLEVGF